MSVHAFQFLVVIISLWVLETSTQFPDLPRSTSGAVLCYNESDQTLHILGGQENPRQWVEYDVQQNQFLDHGQQVLPDDITMLDTEHNEHSSTYWAQISGILYYIHDHDGTEGHNRNFRINQMSLDDIGQANSMVFWQDIPYDTQTWDHCMTAHEDKLIVVGGMIPGWVGKGVKNMAMYDFTTQQWLTGLPLMQQRRQKPACVVNTVENALYVSGGEHFGALDSIEKVSLTNIASQAWQYIADKLTVGVYGHVMIYDAVDNTIFVIGGWDQSVARNEIQRIDCETGVVTAMGALEIAVARPAFVYIAHLRRIYLFGGKVADATGTNQMQIVELSTVAPTLETATPTQLPTPSPKPTAPPTLYPTQIPSSLILPTIVFNYTASPTTTTTGTPTTAAITITSTSTKMMTTPHADDNTVTVTIDMESLSSLFWVASCVFGVCVCGVFGAIIYWCQRRKRMRGSVQPPVQPPSTQAQPQPQPRDAIEQIEIPGVVRAISRSEVSDAQVVVAADDRKQGEEAVVLELDMEGKEEKEQFVFGPGVNHKREGSRLSIAAATGLNQCVLVEDVAERKSDSEELYVVNVQPTASTQNGTSGRITADIDPNLGVYELNRMVDL